MINISDDKKFTEKSALILLIMGLILGAIIGGLIEYDRGFNDGFEFRDSNEPHTFDDAVTDEGRSIAVDWDKLYERIDLHQQALEYKYNTSVESILTECEGDASFYGIYGKYCTVVFSINDTFNVIYIIEKSDVEDTSYIGGD